MQSYVHSKVQFRSLERIRSIRVKIDYEFTENNNWQTHWRKYDLETLPHIDPLASVNFLSNRFFKHLVGFTCGIWNSDGCWYQDYVFSEM